MQTAENGPKTRKWNWFEMPIYVPCCGFCKPGCETSHCFGIQKTNETPKLAGIQYTHTLTHTQYIQMFQLRSTQRQMKEYTWATQFVKKCTHAVPRNRFGRAGVVG